eukprot:Sspe_Gene.77365::Locus_48334_Transcript_1_1_Confidence_1.000_Length_939::g.77365::m.77365
MGLFEGLCCSKPKSPPSMQGSSLGSRKISSGRLTDSPPTHRKGHNNQYFIPPVKLFRSTKGAKRRNQGPLFPQSRPNTNTYVLSNRIVEPEHPTARETERLFHAAESGTPSEVEAALCRGAVASSVDGNDDSPLIFALSNARFRSVDGLRVLRLLATDEIVTQWGGKAVEVAACCGWPEAVSLLVELGAEINPGTVVQALKHSEESDEKPAFNTSYGLSVLKMLLDREEGALTATDEYDGYTALLWAAEKGMVDAIRLLLDAGAAPEKAGPNRMTPLHCASRHSSFESHDG